MQSRKMKSYKKTEKVLLKKLVELGVGMASDSLNPLRDFKGRKGEFLKGIHPAHGTRRGKMRF